MTFQDILAKYRAVSFSERDKGDRFERLMQAFLQPCRGMRGRSGMSGSGGNFRTNGTSAARIRALIWLPTTTGQRNRASRCTSSISAKTVHIVKGLP